MLGPLRCRPFVVLSSLAATVPLSLTGSALGQAVAPGCVPVAAWVAPAGGETLRGEEVVAAAAKRAVVLLGETHDNAEHHRWQLQTIAALHQCGPTWCSASKPFRGGCSPRSIAGWRASSPRPSSSRRRLAQRVERRPAALPADLSLRAHAPRPDGGVECRASLTRT